MLFFVDLSPMSHPNNFNLYLSMGNKVDHAIIAYSIRTVFV